MIVTLPHHDWQVLRAVIRANNAATVEGWKLRLAPVRFNKTGQFLTKLVDRGLLADAGPCPPPSEEIEVTQAVRQPGPFHRYYKITDLGRRAAEYGEYETAGPGLDLPPPARAKAKGRR